MDNPISDQPLQKPLPEATPQEAATFMAELFRGLTESIDRQRKFKSVYANNFHFEPSVWDLKLLCGILEQHTGVAEADWHTAVSMPWVQVKLLAYFLRLQILWHEMQNGPIVVPRSVAPKMEPPTEELAKNPANITWYEASKRIHEQIFGSQDESK